MSSRGDQADLLARARSLLDADRAAKAAALLRAALTPQDGAEGFFLLGVALHRQARRDAALAAFDDCLQRNPTRLDAQLATLVLLVEQNRQATALERCDAWLSQQPSAPLWLARAKLHAPHDNAVAEVDCRRALIHDPLLSEARLMLASLLLAHGAADKAIACIQECSPPEPAAESLLGQACLAVGDYSAAARHFRAALQQVPGDETFRVGLGLALAFLGEYDDARAELARAPGATMRMMAQETPDWSSEQRQRALDQPAYLQLMQLQMLRQRTRWHAGDKHVATVNALLDSQQAPLEDSLLWFQTLWLPVDRDLVLNAARRFSSRLACPAVTRSPRRTTSARLRIGLLSADLRPHPVSRLIAPLVREGDADWHIYASHAPRPCPAVDMLQRHASAFRDLSALSDADAAARIAEDNLDLLVDLTGYTSFLRPGIAARRPAPLQAHYLGYFNTTGAPWFDYALLDPAMAPPGEDRYWTEALLRVAPSLWLYDDTQPIADTPSRATLGLPEEAVVLVSVNSDYKIDPPLFDCWMRVLHAVPGAVLWLTPTFGQVRENLTREAGLRGIAAERLIFSDYEPDTARYLARYRAADLFLDTACCNTGTTSLDALYAGIPVLSLRGDTPSTRKGASILGALGLADCVAASLVEYEAQAIALSSDQGALSRLRQRVSQARSRAPLASASQVARLLAAFEWMIQHQRNGLPATAYSLLP